MSDHKPSIGRRWIVGSLPGPSRTITVEPVRLPVWPRVIPALPPEREPDPERAPRPKHTPRPDREPVPVR
jgi:hypothetical protein